VIGALRSTRRALLVAAGLTVAAIATASPSGAVPGHTSCKGYGHLSVSEAHTKTLVPELHSLPRGTVDDLIAIVQVGGTFGGEAVPPFCIPK
jgi:hypothetical protein